jgi:predicted Ser/Thr protein kinase
LLRDILVSQIKEYILHKEIYNIIPLDRNFTVVFLAQGEYNINFTIESPKGKYVFRVNTGSQLELTNQITYEFNALKVLEISGVTPKVCYVDDSKEFFKYGILIMEFLEGKPLDYKRDLHKAADIFSKIHLIDASKENCSNFIVEENIFSDRVKEGTRLLKDFFPSNRVSRELKDFFYSYLNWCEKNISREKFFIDNSWRVINNTEVNSHNFIIGNNSHYLIDWEKPVISDPCQDLTQFLAPTTTLWKADYLINKEEREMFFKIYSDEVGRDLEDVKHRVELYSPYLLLRALSWCAYAYIEYQREDKEIKNMDTLNKIKQYLEIDFMKNLLKEYMGI